MISAPDYQQQFIQYLETSVNTHAAGSTDTKMLLVSLIDSIPYFGAAALNESLYGTLANILEMYLPNNRLQQQPGSTGSCSTVFQYTGPYSGYQTAFYPGVSLSAAGSQVVKLVNAANSSLNNTWWNDFAVAIITDAIISSKITVNVDTDKLSSSLGTFNSNFLPVLTPAYTGVFQFGYPPTTSAMNSITSAGQSAAVASLLQQSILDGDFTTNLNIALSAGGESTLTATWFEYNLWVSLQVLGVANVNGFIQQAMNTGLIVPRSIQPNNWWNGGYTSWFAPISGTWVLPQAAATISSGFPQMSEVICSPSGGHTSPQYGNYPNGYCISLCEWGSLNWYLPSKSSCFGNQTGVLMADGSVKNINEVETGDLVQTDQGARKVVLVESPHRSNRPLYQLNDEQVFATGAHPFRSGSRKGPFRFAVKPWEVMNNLPTMIEPGVGMLQNGTLLSGRKHHQSITIEVQELKTLETGSAATEKVYDLILENWEKGKVAYYVGGPERFYAVDAETVDPTYHLPTTAGILAAMNIALPACRELLSDPVNQIPQAIQQLDIAALRLFASQAVWKETDVKRTRPSIPSPEYYKQNGQWCAHASALECYLVKYFGCMFRREAATGWRATAIPGCVGNHLSVTLHDLILNGENPVAAGSPLTIALHYQRCDASHITPVTVTIPPTSDLQWFCLIDQVIDLGVITSGPLSGNLHVTIHAGEEFIGEFTTACLDLTTQGTTSNHFVYDEYRNITGRMALEQSRVLPGSLSMARSSAQSWKDQQALAMNLRLGELLGRELVQLMQRNFS